MSEIKTEGKTPRLVEIKKAKPPGVLYDGREVDLLLDRAFRAGQSDKADTARLDWLEKVVCASGYHVELHGCSLTQSNGVVINTGCGSGPFRKSFESPPGPHPLRQAIDAAIAQTQNTQGGKAL